MPWTPTEKDLKDYPHFDRVLTLAEIEALVFDPALVAKHKFLPFLHFSKTWRRSPIGQKNGEKKVRAPKERSIRYAARQDAYIYKAYREILSDAYEQQLIVNGLQDNILAYRRIPKGNGSPRNKSNIEFAKDAFERIDQLGRCCAVAIDISKYFDSMCHERIKRTWADLLGETILPDDHYAVYKNLTKYRWVDRDRAFIALGYSELDKDGRLSFKVDPDTIPSKICTTDQFKRKIADAGLVNKNDKAWGIPQGAPLSDVLANSYLLEFDREMKTFADKRGGFYFRYSDDILFLLPGDGRTAKSAFKRAESSIRKMGSELKIKPEKTEICCFTGEIAPVRNYSMAFSDDGSRLFRTSENQGLSYLGLRYDGLNFYLRSSTINNVKGKMRRSCRATATNHVDRHQNKNLTWLLENAPFSELVQRFFQVKDFEKSVSDARANGGNVFKKMTFFTYSERAAIAFGSSGAGIRRQTRALKRQLSKMLDQEIVSKYQTKTERLEIKLAKRHRS